MHGGEELLARQVEREFPRREVVERARVDPEQLRVAAHLREHGGIDVRLVAQDRFQQIADLEIEPVPLVVEDVAPRQRREVEMPDQNLVFERQRGETVRIHLHHCHVVDPLEEILPRTGHSP